MSTHETHPFFKEIKDYPELEKFCRTDITKLPKPYKGKKTIKAILLGTDPTNDGIKTDKGLKKLDIVFGINSAYERYFFNPQFYNLKAIGLTKEDLFIQNICRNYFQEQTSKNRYWNKVAKIWIKYLKQELDTLDTKLSILVTAEKIMNIIVSNVPSAQMIYNMKYRLPLYSETLDRNIFPLYRHPRYFLNDNWIKYRKLLIDTINE